MKILETEEGWALEHAGRLPIAIEGESYFTDRDLIVAAIEKRDMHVWVDGSVNKRPQPMFEDDDPAPESLSEPEEKPAPEVKPAPEQKPAPEPKTKRPAKTKSTEEPSKGRGRPRVYDPEEAAARRREKAREAAANRTPEQKAEAAERARQWRLDNPDKVKKGREKSMQKRAERYEKDPSFREHFNEYQRSYKRVKRGTVEAE